MTDIRNDQYTTATLGGPGTSFTSEIDFAGDTDMFRAELIAGTSYVIRLTTSGTGPSPGPTPALLLFDSELGPAGYFVDPRGFSGFDAFKEIHFTPSQSGTYFVSAGFADLSYSRQTGSYTVSLGLDPQPAGDVKAGTATSATLAVGGKVKGTVDFAGDQDWYRITLQAGQSYRFTQVGKNYYGETKNGTLEDPFLSLYDAQGRYLATNDDSPGVYQDDLYSWKSELDFTPVETGTYYIAATSAPMAYNTGTYTLLAQVLMPSEYIYESLYVLQPGQTFHNTNQIDVLRPYLVAGNSYSFSMTSFAGGDARLTLAHPSDPQTYLATGNDPSGRNATLDFVPQETGYFIVTAWSGESGATSFEVTMDVEYSSQPVEPPARSPFDWTLLSTSGFAGTIGGDGRIFGTGGFQDIAILDLPGQVILDGSFNKGGDIVRLEGLAGDWGVALSGSAAVFSNGDTQVQIPAGTAGIPVVFDDGIRSLQIDMAAQALKIGGQLIGSQIAQIAAPPDGSPLPTGSNPLAAAQLIMSPGGEVTAGGILGIFGTSADEVVHLLSGNVTLDGSFNKGGDTVVLDQPATSFLASQSGSAILLDGTSSDMLIPVGISGLTLEFPGGDQRSVVIDVEAQAIAVGPQLIGLEPVALSVFA